LARIDRRRTIVHTENKRLEAGMSLVDLMIGAMVGIVLIGAVLSIVVHQGHLRQANTETSLAHSAALNNLELLRSLSEVDLPTMDGKGFDIPGSNGQPNGLHALPDDPDKLPGRLTVVVEKTSGGATLFRAIASVSWRGVTGRRIYSLQTLIGERK
jgi:hypothetical protein